MGSKVERKKFSNNIYVSTSSRMKIESLAAEVGFKNKRIISASAFVKFMIDEFGEEAKNRLLTQ